MRSPIVAIALLLGACATTPAPRPAPVARWDTQVSATAGAALVHVAADGRELIRIACRRNPEDLYVATGWLRSSGAPVLLKVGAETFQMAESKEPVVGLAATSPVPAALPAALMAGGQVSLSQDGRSVGPVPGPDSRMAAAFAIACRGPRR